MRSRRLHVSSDSRLKENKISENHFETTDNGPVERWQHSGRTLEISARTGRVISRATEENILDVLFYQGTLTARQREAALRFKADFMKAGLTPHLVGGYSGLSTSSSFSPDLRARSSAQEKAYQRWRGAIAAMGPMFNDAVITVVCHDVPLDSNHIMLLQAGLFVLVKWYAIGADLLDKPELWAEPFEKNEKSHSREGGSLVN